MSFEEAKKLDDHFVMHTFARKPVLLVEGSGMEVKDDEGKTYLDFIAGIGVDSLGHCHPAVVRAIQDQAAKLIHVSNYYYIEQRGEVAKLLSDMLNVCVPKFFRAPWPVFFANSGAEANECAIKLARLYSKKMGGGGQTNGEGGEISTPLTLYYENDLGGEIIYDTAMNEILTDEAGVVTGVTCTRKGGAKLTLYARRGVILATGGYARNKEMVARYPVAHYFSNVPHGNVGDGLTAAEKIGALNYEHPAVQVVYTSLTCGIGINDESGLIVNDRGERVVNEWSYQYTVSDAIARSGSNCGWYITSGKEPYGGVQYGYKSAVAGKSKDPCATSIEGLAKKMGCDPATLQATYDRYCELVEKGVDEDFGKPAEFLHPIKGPKFVALRMHPCVTVTFGGLETDVSARVMKPDGSVIPHLYAAGEVAGTGMYGTQYPTCGTSIGSALFYGRIAGRAVTDQALL